MAIYRKCQTCGRTWQTGRWPHSQKVYECPACEERRNGMKGASKQDGSNTQHRRAKRNAGA